jgi:hypothetical protein
VPSKHGAEGTILGLVKLKILSFGKAEFSMAQPQLEHFAMQNEQQHLLLTFWYIL